MSNTNRSADWFRRIVWLGIMANLFFAIPALFFPKVLNEWLGFAPEADTVWLRNAGILLVLLNLLYMPAASDPFRYSVYARLTVAARFIAAAFFLWIIWRVPHTGSVWLLFWTDLILGILMAWTLRRAYHLDTSRAYIMRRPFISRFFGGMWRWINGRLGIKWFRLQRHLGAFNLWAVRSDLREHNLHDTETLPKQHDLSPIPNPPENHMRHRTPDGSYNDLERPRMGMTGTRFARNAPHDMAEPDRERMLKPNPREISLRLMTRNEFLPATTLNLLAAAWIQFMNHGWFNHARNEKKKIEIPLPEGDTWTDGDGQPRMQVSETELDPTRPPNSQALPTYLNTESHWWDGSQLYGRNLDQQKRLRTMQDGKMKLDERGWLPIDSDEKFQGHPFELTGFGDNWWVGLSMLHLLFVKEHNAICDMLKSNYPTWNDDRLFNVARLINAALMAKIHTVEWTPGILAHPTLKISMDSNWWGLLGKEFKNRFGRIGKNEALSGIVGSPAEHHTAPYAMTEEFVAVYRLHPLIPDDVHFYSRENHQLLRNSSFTDVQGKFTRPLMEELTAAHNGNQADLFYSFGVTHPGAITLHNFPRALQNFERTNGEKLDLAAIDILRDRERGVPRYNDFREMLRLPRAKSFDELTDNAQWAKEIAEVYDQDIDQVDLLVGLLAEPLPPGFGFSDTAFRIFILMASRRLKSDRFFTDFWNEETYTKEGLKWVDDNTMISVLLRHQPELRAALDGVGNGFAPWNRAT